MNYRPGPTLTEKTVSDPKVLHGQNQMWLLLVRIAWKGHWQLDQVPVAATACHTFNVVLSHLHLGELHSEQHSTGHTRPQYR